MGSGPPALNSTVGQVFNLSIRFFRLPSYFSDRLETCPTTRGEAAKVGIEPTASWFRARRHYQQQLFRNGCFLILKRTTQR